MFVYVCVVILNEFILSYGPNFENSAVLKENVQNYLMTQKVFNKYCYKIACML